MLCTRSYQLKINFMLFANKVLYRFFHPNFLGLLLFAIKIHTGFWVASCPPDEMLATWEATRRKPCHVCRSSLRRCWALLPLQSIRGEGRHVVFIFTLCRTKKDKYTHT